jgi:hypothetical protein
MAPRNKDSGATRMAGAHMFQAIKTQEPNTLCLVAIRDFLKKRAQNLRLVAQKNKVEGFIVTLITVLASIDLVLLENHIGMEKIDADSMDKCTDDSVMEILQSAQERDASVTAEFAKEKFWPK